MSSAEPNNSGTGGGATKGQAKDEKKGEDLLSKEDLALKLKQQLELYVEMLQHPDLQKLAIESMRQEILTAITSMTSVRKPIKFSIPHYRTLKAHYQKMADSDLKKLLADILSVLALTMSREGERESLKYRLLGSEGDDIGSWGHEYVTNLAGEIAQEYAKRRQSEQGGPIDDLVELVPHIVAFLMKHNAEPEAVDLLIAVEDLAPLVHHVDTANYKMTCLYLTGSAKNLTRPIAMIVLNVARWFYMKFEEYPRALQIALHLDNYQYVKELFGICKDRLERQQFCFILARHGVRFQLDEDMVVEEEERDALQGIINNSKLSQGYLTLARDIDVMEPKSPEDINKARLIDGRGSGVDLNLAATFVNAFVNAGFGQDKLMTVPSSNWLFKNKKHGKASAAASLGLIHLWDVDSGVAQLDKYFHSTDTHAIAGALLGVGIVNCNVRDESDPALALLAEHVEKEDSSIKIGAIMGLGLAYAGSQNERVRDALMQQLGDGKSSLDVVAFTAISLGLVFLGSCNGDIARAIIKELMDRSESELGDPLARFLSLGLGLLYFGKQESVEATVEVSKTFNEKIRKHCDVTLISCAYAGARNCRKVQHLLGRCAKNIHRGEAYQGEVILGISLVPMAEDSGRENLEMAIFALENFFQIGEPNVRRAVPLALGLLCTSDPKVKVMEMLSRLSHDADSEVAMGAIISLGLIGAGTHNARIATMLRNLSCHYDKDASLLFCVQIAQGLVHLGKGLLTLSPYHSERFLLSPVALAGIVIVLNACLDMKAFILGKYHYVLYFLTLAMQPRMLMTVDENLKPLSVPVRVGQAVDGQAGRPRTIKDFQTHSTPVILAAGEGAELATQKYIPVSPILEGFVILRENPDYKEDN